MASALGGILVVCSCSVLPIFAGICRLGAGLGPANGFLDSEPAVSLPNMLVLRGMMGANKMLVFSGLTVVMAGDHGHGMRSSQVAMHDV